MRVLRLLDIHRGRDCLVVGCALDDLRFHFTIWYEDVDLGELARRHGDELVDRLAVHAALFQVNAVSSLRPDALALGRYAPLATPRLVALWRRVFRGVWAQWRWQHDLPAYEGPAFVDAPAAAPPPRPVAVPDGPVELLAFCGGGKDSLVAAKLLERARLPFATLAYSHSIYGPAEPQHALIERVAAATARSRAERQWVIDDFLDAPVARLRPELVASCLAAETPASVFAALPLALARGYRGLVVAHERGANTPNLVWDATGEAVNHQWGKGWEAERLLDEYVRAELLANVRYFSVLQPVHDEVVLELCARDPALAARTHSCNVRKPWCRECPKCVYVWLQMMAHLPPDVVHGMFGVDLAALPQNAPRFEELLGLAAHPPFECVGGVDEARLAFAQARAASPSLERWAAAVGPLDVAALAAPLLEVSREHGMPAHVAAGVMPQLEDAARAARRRLGVG